MFFPNIPNFINEGASLNNAMGFFSRFFKKENKDEPVYPVEDVKLSGLSEWFVKRTSSRFKGMEKDLSHSLDAVKKQSEDLKKYLESLKEAELMNKDIPEKERQVMEGNRSSYLQQTGIFLSQLNFPEVVNYRTALDFTDNMPLGLYVATPSNAATSCVGGTLTATEAGGTISYTGGSVPAASVCTVT